MAGTKAGGIAAAKTNKAKYGDDFYARVGRIGGKKGTTGGFAANRELARIAGAKGGKVSRRRKSTAPRCINGHLLEHYNLTDDGACIKCVAKHEREQADAMHFSKFDGEGEVA